MGLPPLFLETISGGKPAFLTPRLLYLNAGHREARQSLTAFPENQHNPQLPPNANVHVLAKDEFMIYIVRKTFLRAAIVLGLFTCLGSFAFAQQEQPLRSVTYRLSMSRPVSHLFEVTIEVELAPGELPKSLDFQMPMWSPGRYAVFDFAKNVQEFQALGGI